MRPALRSGAIWLAGCGLLLCCPVAEALHLFRPKIGVPEFTVPGGTFRAEVKAAAGLASNQWAIFLANDLRAWTNCALERVAYGPYVNNGSCTGYELTVRVPTNVPPELFKVIVGHPGDGAATNRGALSVVTNLDTDFYILHYADPQHETSNAVYASGMSGTHGSIQEIYWHAPAFRLINPRFFFNTGDEIDNGYTDTTNRYAQYLNAVSEFNAPLLISRGNNETTDLGFWETNISPATFSITMGSFYVCLKDYISDTAIDWFRADYSNSFRNTNITFHLFGQHYNSGSSAFSSIAGQYPDLMLVGHNHSFSTLSTSPYYVLSSGAAFNYGSTAFFEFRKNGTNWLCPGRTNHPGGTRFYPVGDWGATNLSSTFASPNDGAAFTNSVRITNNLAFTFWDGRVRFLVRKARFGYQVAGGLELAEYDYNGTNTAVLVKVNIASNAVTVVSVYRSDSDADGMPDEWEMANFTNLTTAGTNTDYDFDELLDWQEYTAGTQPTNDDSYFQALVGAGTPSPSGFVVRWSSISNRHYDISRSTNLASGFSDLAGATNLPATPWENSWTDSVGGIGAAYYRVGVRGEE